MIRRFLSRFTTHVTPIGSRLDIFVVHVLIDPGWGYRFGPRKQPPLLGDIEYRIFDVGPWTK